MDLIELATLVPSSEKKRSQVLFFCKVHSMNKTTSPVIDTALFVYEVSSSVQRPRI